MGVWEDAQAFVQGEVGKFLAIPTTLTQVSQRLDALAASGKVDASQIAAWRTTLQDVQGRYQGIAGTVQQIVVAVQTAGGASNLTLDQQVTLGANLLTAGTQVVGVLSDASNLDQATQQAYYGAGFTGTSTVPWWVWVGGGGAVLYWLTTRKRRRA